MDGNQSTAFKLACHAGVLTLENGGETFRAEETVRFICSSAGIDADVLALPTGIIVSAEINGEPQSSSVKRIKKRSIDLNKLNEINKISRRFVSGELDEEGALTELDELNNMKPINKFFLVLFTGISSLFFALLFEGSLFDSVIAFLASSAVQTILIYFKRTYIYNFTSNLVVGFVVAMFAACSVAIFSMGNIESIIVGGILPYLPGLAMTNAIRDTMMGDLVSGISRLGEVLLSAVSLAMGAGIVFAVYIYLGGVV
ncbi:MAG: threonine/serine exporter family protein [Clostridia bacterium]|nr:threonine/serine exporter family protein [Clostridia bacterium]